MLKNKRIKGILVYALTISVMVIAVIVVVGKMPGTSPDASLGPAGHGMSLWDMAAKKTHHGQGRFINPFTPFEMRRRGFFEKPSIKRKRKEATKRRKSNKTS